MAKACVLQSTLLPAYSPLHKLRNQNFTLSFPPLPVSRCRPGIHCSVSAGETTTRSVEEAPEISWGCEIDSLENATSLQNWLSDSGLPPQKMAIDRVDIGERGLVASQNLRKGEKLLFVPPSLVISADSVSSHSYFHWESKNIIFLFRENFDLTCKQSLTSCSDQCKVKVSAFHEFEYLITGDFVF